MSSATDGTQHVNRIAEDITSVAAGLSETRLGTPIIVHSSPTPAKVGGPKLADYALLVLLLIGIGLRCAALLSDRNLWIDEAMLALNLLARTPLHLFEPLDWNQGAPVGFLIVAKLSVLLFGSGEISLRLVPFLGSVSGLLLFAGVARQLLPTRAALLATGLFVCSPSLVSYAGECKQYATDAAGTVLLFAVAAPLLRSRFQTKTWFALAGAGAVSVWFSHSATFVLGGIGTALLFESVVHRNRLRFVAASLVIGCWLASFGACYFISLRHLGTNAYLIEFWAGHFMPLPPRSLGDCAWIFDHVLQFFVFPGWFGGPNNFVRGFAALLFGLGMLGFGRDRWPLAVAILMPAVLALFASGFHRYPFAGRMLLFLVPLAILGITRGAMLLTAPLRRRLPILSGVILASLAFPSLLETVKELLQPSRNEQIEPMLEAIHESWQPGDRLYVYYGALPAYEYYTRKHPFPASTVVRGTGSRHNRDAYREQISQFKGQPRVWLLFSHRHRDEESVLTGYASGMGHCVSAFKGEGAALYLFDFSAPPDTAE